MNPTAFIPDESTTLWVMDNKVAVFNIKHAEIVFMHNFSGQVWGINGTTANLLLDMAQAIDFFLVKK